jgi:hypothetical protein
MDAEGASKLSRSGVQWTATPISSDQIQSLSFEAYEEHDQTQVKHHMKSEHYDDDRHPYPCRCISVAPIKCSLTRLPKLK